MTRLGQNFLTSKKIAAEIVEAADIKPTDTVLEIGPGKGILTEELIKNAGMVIAVEKDEKFVELLREKFSALKNLKIIKEDILEIKNSDLFKNFPPEADQPPAEKIKNYKIISNIPYYITGAIIKKFLSSDYQPSDMVLMVQKEVGERIVAKNNKQSILSISVKAYGQPKIIKNVSAKHFIPKPKVDSVVLKISDISKDFFNLNYRGRTSIVEEKFFKLVRKGFSSKRKMLKNNLSISKDILKTCNLSEKIRAEELNLEDWRNMYNQIYK